MPTSQPSKSPEPAPKCASSLVLDQFRLGALRGRARRDIAGHVESCTSCRSRLDAMVHERARFVANPDPAWLRALVQSDQGTRTRWVPQGVGVLAAASVAVVLSLAWWRAPTVPELAPPAEFRTKGAEEFGAFIKHGSEVRPAEQGDTVAPGDALRFYYRRGDPGYFAILNIDGSQTVSAFYPLTSMAAVVEPGERRLLPASTILDDVPGDERLLGVFCEASFNIEDVVSELQAGGDFSMVRDDCQVLALTLHKPSGPNFDEL